jgi:hypothetical protein
MPFLPPFTTPPPTSLQAQTCVRCGHAPTYHRAPASCRVRLTWRHLWRRCSCEGYAPPGSVTKGS